MCFLGRREFNLTNIQLKMLRKNICASHRITDCLFLGNRNINENVNIQLTIWGTVTFCQGIVSCLDVYITEFAF